MHVRLESHDGEPVVLKVATTEPAVGRLAAECDRLRAARHPGVVELLGVGEEPLTATLAWAGGSTLETARPPTAEAITVLASVASTVADLHGIGVVHGRIDPSHVVLDGDGQPRLCGFGPTAGVDGGAGPADDVAAIGALIRLLAGEPMDTEPIPDRRLSRPRWSGYLGRAMLTLADQATDPDVERRPTARALGRSLADLAPAPAATDHPRRRAAARRDRRTPVAIGIVLLVGALVALALGRGNGPRRGQDAARTAPAAPTATTTARPPAASASAPVRPSTSTTSTSTSTTTRHARRCPAAAEPSVDVDGDGCREAVRIDGSTIHAGASAFRTGLPDDELAVGDWDCDGTATPAVVRPATGEVFVFGRWARRARPLTMRATAVVPGISGPRAPVQTTCGPLRAVRRDGATTTIRLPAGAP